MNNRVAILCDFNLATYDTGDPTLFKLVDYIHCFHYPCFGSGEMNSIAGIEGDPVYVMIPFQVQTAKNAANVMPLMKTARIQIVAVKTGKNDFIVEEKVIDISSTCINGNIHNVNISETKGYVSFTNDPYNSVLLYSNNAYTQGTMQGYVAQYGLKIRYDYWNNILSTLPGGVGCNNDISNDIQNINNSWSNLSTNGWSLVFRFSIDIIGYDGTITPFQTQTTIESLPMASLPDSGMSFAGILTYADLSNDPEVGIISGSQTLISATFTPNGGAMPSGFDSYYGTIFADLLNSGGVSNLRFASTEMPSESGSPFSAAPVLGAGYTSYINGNVTMNINNSTGVIVLQTIYDDTILNWGENTIISPRVGFRDSSLQSAAGNDLKTAGGNNIIAA